DGDDAVEYFHFREGACAMADSPALFVDVDLQLIADGMTSPVGVVAVPGDNSRLYVIDQTGQIWVIENGVRNPQPFLDVSDRIIALSEGYDERGLLGLAFHPQFSSNSRFYVYYTAPPGAGGPMEGEMWDNRSRISEFTASSPTSADAGSERIVLEVDQPQSNHEGGTIAFGPDGYLYISIGDGGNANDVGPGHVQDWYDVNAGGNGQDNFANLLGNILRRDVDGAAPYEVPGSNPFVGEDG
ncbi:PQQ-dependent sugar dehydrogenase, partial [Salinimicrobium oceani]